MKNKHFIDIIRSWKRIPYFLNFFVEEKDKEECDKNIDNTLENINNYVESVEFHEKIHCFIFRLFGIPSMIIYCVKYTPSSNACWALCRPLISGGILKAVICDILHFSWDLLTDFIDSFFKSKYKAFHIRSPIEVIKFFINSLLVSIKIGDGYIKYHSFEEIKIIAEEDFLNDIKSFNKGVFPNNS